MTRYPINGSELARLLLGDESRARDWGDFKFVQHGVRAKLREFGCPKQSGALRSDWVVDEEMAKRVRDDEDMAKLVAEARRHPPH